MKAIKFIILFIITYCLSVFAQGQSETEIDNIPLREKIAQMLMVSIEGTEAELNSEVLTIVKDLKIGGIIIFEKWGKRVINIKSQNQLAEFTKSIKRTAEYPIWIAIDQEGGKVSRLKEKYGYPPTITPEEIGDINKIWFTKMQAMKQAMMLNSSGINMNFAPSLDININPKSPAIGKLKRSFSSDPKIVYNIAEIYYDIQKDSGIVSVFKHFPGHGSAVTDSHNGFTDITNTSSKSELEIYNKFINAGKCDAIMCSHLFNSNIDSEYPASLSKKTLTNLMRNEIGYEGLFITDDIGMKALSENWTTEEIIKLSINAGVDIIMVLRGNSYYYRQIINLIEKMVIKDEIPLSRINESYTRIMKLHKAYKGN